MFTLHQYQIFCLVIRENNECVDISVETTPGVFYEVREEEDWPVRGIRRNVDQVQGQESEDKCALLLLTEINNEHPLSSDSV